MSDKETLIKAMNFFDEMANRYWNKLVEIQKETSDPELLKYLESERCSFEKLKGLLGEE